MFQQREFKILRYMNFSPLDLIVFVGFFVVVIGLSVWKSRLGKGHVEDSSDFFLAGRDLKWPLIGISIVAANISTEQMVGMAGQAAGGAGLAVSAWQLMGSVFIVVSAMTLLPKFLRAGIYTIPEFLEYRYNTTARTIMALLTVVIYGVVMLPAVLYSGGVTLHAVAGMDLNRAIWLVGAVGTCYCAVGGLKAIAWADLVQGLALLAGGLLVFFLGLDACGGWAGFSKFNEAKLHMVLPASHPDLPWTGVFGGMWIVMIYYCGLNQFIVQRNLAAKSLKHGQMGMIFAGALWLIVPFGIVMPGMIAQQLFADKLVGKSDSAFPTMITELIQPGVRGFIYAAIAGAVTSTLASLLNSASTIATMDIYRNVINQKAGQGRLVWLGRVLTLLFVLCGCLIAPALGKPEFGGVFAYIQQFQGYIWPGVVAAFLGAFALPRAPAFAGTLALVTGPLAYGILQFTARTESRLWGHGMHFLIQVLVAFGVVSVLMLAATLWKPLEQPKILPDRIEIPRHSELSVKIAGGLVIIAVVIFFVVFW
jgi:SSS family solute:Na+ symporter